MSEWIGELRFSDAVIAKIRTKHNLSPEQVKQAVTCGAHDQAVWHNDPEYGRRLVVTGRDLEGTIVAYLRPIDREDGLWRCLTAIRMV